MLDLCSIWGGLVWQAQLPDVGVDSGESNQ